MNKYIKYVVVLLIVIVIGAFLYWRANNNQAGMEGQVIAFNLIDRGNYGTYSQIITVEGNDDADELSVAVVENSADWRRFWEDYVREIGTGGFDDVPEVDFSQNLVIAVLQGVKPTGGYYLNTDNVVGMKNGVILNMNIVEPDQDEGLSQAVSSPYDVIIIPRQEVLSHKNSRLQVINQLNGELVLDEVYANLVYHSDN